MKLYTIQEAKELQSPFVFVEMEDFKKDNLTLKTFRSFTENEITIDITYQEQFGFGDVLEKVKEEIKTKDAFKDIVVNKLKNGEQVYNNSLSVIKTYSKVDEVIVFEMEDFEDIIIPLMEAFDLLRRLKIEEIQNKQGGEENNEATE